MSSKLKPSRSLLVTLSATCALTALFVGCGEDADPGSGKSSGSGGTSAEAGDGNEPSNSGGSTAAGGDGSSSGGSGGSGAQNGSGGAPETGSGGNGNGGTDTEDPAGGAGGLAAGGGEGGADGFENLSLYCPYDEDVGAGGTDGAGGASSGTGINVAVNAVLGQILVDAAGLTLYTVGRDSPGDCDFAPSTDCTTASCLTAWPPFYAGDGALGAGLDAAVFGTFERPDGNPQTTYYGWPLYYYANDTAAGAIGGQGKQGLWHAAEVTQANIIAMRAPGTTVNYLAAANGRSLYVHTLDTLGNDSDPPGSACTGSCLKKHPPFLLDSISVVSSLEPADFSLFEREDGEGLQVAYKGAPLYFDITAKKPGKLADPMPENWGLALK